MRIFIWDYTFSREISLSKKYRQSGMPELVRFMKNSLQLMKDTEELNSKAVAEGIERYFGEHKAGYPFCRQFNRQKTALTL